MLVPSGPADFKHLFAIALGPASLGGYGNKPHVIMVSVTSVKPEFPHDAACVIMAGEHPFITHDSYVYYRDPRIESVDHVQKMVDQAVWQARESCSPELLARIRQGLKTSSRVPRYVKKMLD
ncbi:hypothetical protein [Pantoea sp. 18069]|uniref:hypothetical protein n=1 Tax=Pantoea sp. 18069 TaxID=2681415 RepID=UPI001F334E6A|nr:hypothetical protein [Pantoea sp. 18069]